MKKALGISPGAFFCLFCHFPALVVAEEGLEPSTFRL